MLIKKYVLVFAFIFLSSSSSFASEIYYIDFSGNQSTESIYLDAASKYYGIEIVHCSREDTCLNGISSALTRNSIDGVILAANSLSGINYIKFSKLFKEGMKKIPVMIFGISPGNNEEIKLWSNDSIRNVESISTQPLQSYYLFSEDKSISRQLSGLSLINKSRVVNVFNVKNKDELELIENLSSGNDNVQRPIFIKNTTNNREIFFLSKIANDNSNDIHDNRISKENFYEIAPFMMFIRYSCKDRCWHSNKYFANLTIDDPWLREPYGNLSYFGLLGEMKKEKFHTTIAFVPWNYDRSEPDVATLIRNNPGYYSIVIHGDDHNHKEFYELSNDGKLQAKQLNLYEKKIKQALARMEKFKELTKIPYDSIMVFPHNIAPQYTFRLLKKYGFLATVNSRNVPQGAPEPNDPTYRLRWVTTDFEDFPSYRRNGNEYISKEDIAIELFLENPVLIFRHQGDFADNIGNFNTLARIINNLQPDVKWGSLGYIIRNYHLEKQKDDGNYEIMMYANELTLNNTSNVSKKYFIKKKELPSYSKSLEVFIDGRPALHKYNNGFIRFEIMIPKNQSREISIKYGSEMDFLKTDVSKNNYYYATLRYISDFRDIIVSKNKYGRKIIGSYYNQESFKNIIVIFIVVFCLSAVAVIYIYKNRKIHRDK